jgi:hypothetical protein
MSTIHDLGLGQPVGGGGDDAQTVPPRLDSATTDAVSVQSVNTVEAADTVKEIPTTNPAVHVVLTNPPSPAQTRKDTMSLHPDHPVNRARADTTASSISTSSFASTTGTSDADDDEDDYDPAQGGDEKTCIKEKRVKEWTKRFHPGSGEELLCSECERKDLGTRADVDAVMKPMAVRW